MLPGRPRRAVRRHCGSAGARPGSPASPDALEHSPVSSPPSRRAGSPIWRGASTASKKEWHLARQGLNLKRYPICYATHRAIDAAIELATRHDLQPRRRRTHPRLHRGMQMLMLRNERPANRVRGQVQHAVRDGVLAGGEERRPLAAERRIRRAAPKCRRSFPASSTATTTETMDGSAFAPSESVEITTVERRGFRERADRLRQGQQAAAAVARRAASQVLRMPR